MSYVDLVCQYFQARDFDVQEKDKDLVVARQPGPGGRTETTCVWILTSEQRKSRPSESVEEELLGRFGGAQTKFRGARLYLLVETTEGMSVQFRQRARRDYGVTVTVPVQFFDWSFKYESAPQSASAIKELAAASARYQKLRVPQPYLIEETGERGDDVVHGLERQIESHRRGEDPLVWFIVAPAGQGKSVTFSALFGHLNAAFQRHKSRQELYPRPLPMLPAHLREAGGHSLRGLINAFLQTDIVGHATRRQLDWLIDRGFVLWMLDGLDEVVTRDDDFFEYLEDRITAPSSRPRIVISVRDSVFHSSRVLREFNSFYRSVVRVVSLQAWERNQRRAFAWVKLANRLPGPGENDPGDVAAAVRLLCDDPVAGKLASLPFYAGLMLDDFVGQSATPLRNELDLLDRSVDAMCRREYQKPDPYVDESTLPISAMREWLEELAVSSYESGGVSPDDLRELATLLPALTSRDLDREEEARLVEHITMAPFLSRSEISGQIDFAHEILGEFLAGRRFVHEFESRPVRFLSRLSSRTWPPGSVLFPVIADGIRGKEDDLLALIREEGLTHDGMTNVVQILALGTDGGARVREALLLHPAPNLEGLRLRSLNLDGASLQNSNLSNADLRDCTLRGARLEGAVLHNTRLPDGRDDGLRDATFGDAENFESVVLEDGRAITDHRRFLEWVERVTGEKRGGLGPCLATRQVRHLFGKFVHADGSGRRDSLPLRACLRGAQIPGAPDHEQCLQRAIEFGYLEQSTAPRPDRVERCRGEKYGEIVALVKNSRLSPGLASLMDSLCNVKGCRHGAQS